MSGRFHTRGRNTHWSDGRPAGFQMPLRKEEPALRLTTFIAIALTVACIFYFGGHLLLAWAYGAP